MRFFSNKFLNWYRKSMKSKTLHNESSLFFIFLKATSINWSNSMSLYGKLCEQWKIMRKQCARGPTLHASLDHRLAFFSVENRNFLSFKIYSLLIPIVKLNQTPYQPTLFMITFTLGRIFKFHSLKFTQLGVSEKLMKIYWKEYKFWKTLSILTKCNTN